MAAKLDWNYDNALECEVAYINTDLRIKAEHDDSPSNPFKDWDGHWPMLTYSDRDLTVYDKVSGAAPDRPFSRFTPALVVFCQKQLAEIFDADPNSALDVDVQRKWHTNGKMLESFFADSLDGGYYESQKLAVYEQLYDLLGIPCYRSTSRGYSQGDWAEVLVVATPEARKEFGWADDREVTEAEMESQVDLYTAWAWGDVYGYVVEEAVRLPDADADDDPEWEEISDGSCWGYYGADHTKSGLEESGLEAANYHLSRVAVKEGV